MKGQLIPLLFIVLVISFILIGYVFYNIFYGIKYQGQVFQIVTIDVVRNLIEDIKNFLKLSLTYSSQQSLREHACSMGLIGASDWICNGPNPVKVPQSKDCLAKYTNYYLNIYMDYLNTSLPLDIYKKNFTTCVVGVNEQGALQGAYDEGNFWVNCSDALVEISGQNIKESEGMNMNYFVTKDRYWYMFRNFYDWAMADVYSPCICGNIGCACGSSSGQEVCSQTCQAAGDQCAKTSLDDLQARFNILDDNVTCEVSKGCCAQGIGPSCGPHPSSCLAWDNTICTSNCQHDCRKPSTADICPTGSTQSSVAQMNYGYGSPNTFSTNSNPNSFQGPPPDCYCDYWYEARFAARYEFTCTDQKYYVPSDSGPVPLVFRATAVAFWRKPDACFGTMLCGCATGMTDCSQCSNAGCCTACY